MQILDDKLVLSATDLVGFAACLHLTRLEVEAANGKRERPHFRDPVLDLLRRKGEEHERRFLDRLRRDGARSIDLTRGPSGGVAALIDAHGETVAAMREGYAVIYQGTLFDGRWRGHPDFLLRVDRPSALGAWSYEPMDTKLAQRVSVGALLQLSLYAALLGEAQGGDPVRMSVLTGKGERRDHRVADYQAYFRQLRSRLEEALKSAGDSYPDPVDHCRVCRWFQVCADRRRDDDHLSRVAGITRSHTRLLVAAGCGTLSGLALRREDVPGIPGRILERLTAQARLQAEQYRDGVVRYELIPHDPSESSRGLGELPAPSPGDLFLDIEADPWAGDAGLEYLLGVAWETESGVCYEPIWAHSAADEKLAFERLIDLVQSRRANDPAMHVYHYGAYEAAAVRRLAARHGTRLDEVDVLLRERVLVDLYAVLRHSLRVSQESYSLKKVEKLYMPVRQGPVTRPGFAVVEFERWIETGDPGALAGIADYNRDDCVSACKLRTWLEERRAEVWQALGVELGRPGPIREPTEAASLRSQESAARIAKLTSGLPEDPADQSPEQRARWLLAQLVEWHRREEKPQWWLHFDAMGRSMPDLVQSADTLGDLVYAGEVGEVGRSVVHRYRYDPVQEHGFKVGDTPYDPATRKPAGTVVSVDHARGSLDLKRGKTSATPHPSALIPGRPVSTDALRRALAVVVDHVIEHGVEGEGPYRAARQLLMREPPRFVSGESSAFASERADIVSAACRLAETLDESTLSIQGPPGSGKTFTGARMVVALAQAGKKIGVTATAHKAITNFLDEIGRAAVETRPGLKMVQRADRAEASEAKGVAVAERNADVWVGLERGAFQVAAGTPWLFAAPEMAGAVDVLFVDEAGQMSLANVVAMSGAARSMVLLGDPNQLPQVTQGTHPPGAAASALEHVLGGEDTIPGRFGIFLSETRRLHPDLCKYVSEAFYDGRLHAHPFTSRVSLAPRAALPATGCVQVELAHRRNATRSREEAEWVAQTVQALIGSPWTDRTGSARKLALEDILVVAPYNAQVAEISRALERIVGPGGRVGTVDKFQGQEGAVVLFSMASSTPEDAPRETSFLFSRNRLNVAVSRAQALAIVVSSAELLWFPCKSPDDLRMANAFCLFMEHARRTRVDSGKPG